MRKKLMIAAAIGWGSILTAVAGCACRNHSENNKNNDLYLGLERVSHLDGSVVLNKEYDDNCGILLVRNREGENLVVYNGTSTAILSKWSIYDRVCFDYDVEFKYVIYTSVDHSAGTWNVLKYDMKDQSRVLLASFDCPIDSVSTAGRTVGLVTSEGGVYFIMPDSSCRLIGRYEAENPIHFGVSRDYLAYAVVGKSDTVVYLTDIDQNTKIIATYDTTVSGVIISEQGSRLAIQYRNDNKKLIDIIKIDGMTSITTEADAAFFIPTTDRIVLLRNNQIFIENAVHKFQAIDNIKCRWNLFWLYATIYSDKIVISFPSMVDGSWFRVVHNLDMSQ